MGRLFASACSAARRAFHHAMHEPAAMASWAVWGFGVGAWPLHAPSGDADGSDGGDAGVESFEVGHCSLGWAWASMCSKTC